MITARSALLGAGMLAPALLASSCSARFDSPDGSATVSAEETRVVESMQARVLVESLRLRFPAQPPLPIHGLARADKPPTAGSIIGEAVADHMVRNNAGIHGHFAESVTRPLVHRVELSLPERSQQPFKLVDTDSSLSVEVSLDEVSDAPAESAGGYVVYRGQGGSPDLIQRPIADGTEDYVHFPVKASRSQLTYQVRLGGEVRGVRLVDRVVEFLDEKGVPRLRMSRPDLVDGGGHHAAPDVTVTGCAVDTDPTPPWNRKPKAPGASSCEIRLSWADTNLVYPIVIDPTWSTTAYMTAPRYLPTATKFSDGTVLIAGGQNNSGVLSSTELFSPATNVFAASNPMLTARMIHTATSIQSYTGATDVIIAGGVDANYHTLNTVEYNSPAHSSTTIQGMMQNGRYHHAATLVSNGNVLICGGYSAIWSSNPLNTCDLMIWLSQPGYTGSHVATTGSMMERRGELTMDVLSYLVGTHIYLWPTAIGGDTGTGAAASWETYSESTGLWTDNTSPEPSPARWAHSTGLANGYLWMFGGYTGSVQNGTNQFQYRNYPQTWTTTGPLYQARLLPGVVPLTSGKLAAIGGWADGASPASYIVDVLDPTTGNTSLGASLNTGRYGHTTTALADGRIMVVGGYNNGYLESVEFLLGLYGESCTSNTQCQSGFCASGVCCKTNCACGTCNSTGDCAHGSAGAPGAPSCAPYVCDGTNTACPGACTNSCASGYECKLAPNVDAGACLPVLTQGGPCSTTNDCASGLSCLNNICSSASSCGLCGRYDIAGFEGTCHAVPRGTVSSCSPSACDGTSTSCPSPSSSCTIDPNGVANCAPGYGCIGNVCTALLALGTACASNAQCASGFCAGVCCKTACNGIDNAFPTPDNCTTCTVTPGTCTPVTTGSCAPFVGFTATTIDRTTPTSFFAANNFLITGSPAIQACNGLSGCTTPITIDSTRAAVVRGNVLTPSGLPLAGATVKVLNHPEFGSTTSRGDGYYDMIVNGGGTLVLQFDATNSPTVQRQVKTPWLDWVVVPPVIMTPVESSTAVTLNSSVWQTIRGCPSFRRRKPAGHSSLPAQHDRDQSYKLDQPDHRQHH